MTEEQFIKLSQKGEGTQIEYKTCTEQVSESLYETVCSFLNHSGGQIICWSKGRWRDYRCQSGQSGKT